MSFTHLQDGTSEAAWQAAGVADLSLTAAAEEIGPETVLVLVVAHPDDETLGATGLIRSVLRAGGRVELILCTAGEGSHPDSPTHTPERLRELRRVEMRQAVQALTQDVGAETADTDADAGPAAQDRLTLRMLDLPDGALAEHTEQIEAAVLAALEAAPDATPDATSQSTPAHRPLLATHYRLDGHTDHEALGHTLAQIAEEHSLTLYEFPLWYWHWADPERDHAWRHWTRWPLDGTAQRARAAALRAHRSQTQPLSSAPGDEAILSPTMLEHFARPFDVLHRTTPDGSDASRTDRVFDRLYTQHQDPWHYLTSWYEQRKRQITLAVLPQRRYGTVLEIGSSIGVLTADLAERAERVLALEASTLAVQRSRERLAQHPNVEVHQAVLPADWSAAVPDGQSVDLAVLSEVGYFLRPQELSAVLERVESALSLSGQLVLCHWNHPIQDWPLDGADVHAAVRADPRFRRVTEHCERDFTVEVFARATAAQRAAVVVPAHNEEELLPRCLTALAQAADRWEDLHGQGTVLITVAVDHCTDATVARAQEHAAQDARFHVLELDAGSTQAQAQDLPDGGTVGAARDAGLRWGVDRLRGGAPGGSPSGGDESTDGERELDRIWVASTDADSMVPPDWLVAQAALATRAARDRAGTSARGESEPEPGAVVVGTVMPVPGDLEEEVFRLWSAEYEHREGHPHVHGANIGMPWTVYEHLGGFPHLAADEDVALVEAARAAGVPVVATDRTRVLTSGRTQGRAPAGFAGYLHHLEVEGVPPVQVPRPPVPVDDQGAPSRAP